MSIPGGKNEREHSQLAELSFTGTKRKKKLPR